VRGGDSGREEWGLEKGGPGAGGWGEGRASGSQARKGEAWPGSVREAGLGAEESE